MDTTSKGILPKTTITREALEELIKKWEMLAVRYELITQNETGVMQITCIGHPQLLSCISDLNTLLATT